MKEVMVMSAVVIGLKQCPECSSEKLIPVGVGEEVNFFCRDCALCWNLKNGRPVIIDPQSCPGCGSGAGDLEFPITRLPC